VSRFMKVNYNCNVYSVNGVNGVNGNDNIYIKNPAYGF